MLNIDVEVLLGNISTAKVDGFVVPQYADKFSLTGVSGTFLHTRCYAGMIDYGALVGDKPLPPGGVLVTNTEDCGKFINVVALGLEKENAFMAVQLATYAALVEAENNNLTTIAMPALGTGESGHLTFEKSAQAMLSALAMYKSQGVLKKVDVYVFQGHEAFEAYQSIVEGESYRPYMNEWMPQIYEAMKKITAGQLAV